MKTNMRKREIQKIPWLGLREDPFRRPWYSGGDPCSSSENQGIGLARLKGREGAP